MASIADNLSLGNYIEIRQGDGQWKMARVTAFGPGYIGYEYNEGGMGGMTTIIESSRVRLPFPKNHNKTDCELVEVEEPPVVITTEEEAEEGIPEEHKFEPSWAATLTVTVIIFDDKGKQKRMVLHCSPFALAQHSPYFSAVLESDHNTKSIELPLAFSAAEFGAEFYVKVRKESVLAVFQYLHAPLISKLLPVQNPISRLEMYHQLHYINHTQGMNELEPSTYYHSDGNLVRYKGSTPPKEMNPYFPLLLISQYYNSKLLFDSTLEKLASSWRRTRTTLTNADKYMLKELSKDLLIDALGSVLQSL